MARIIRGLALAVIVAAIIAIAAPSGAAHAQGLKAASCGYTIKASTYVPGNPGDGRLRIWDDTCTNQVHAQLISYYTNCVTAQYLYVVEYGVEKTGQTDFALCGSGSYYNTGSVAYAQGNTYSWAQLNYFYAQTGVV